MQKTFFALQQQAQTGRAFRKTAEESKIVIF